MATLLSARPTGTADNGGAPARRAIVRWALRLLRREWRSQILVLALLTLAVAAATGGASAAFNLAPAEGNAERGSADQSLHFENADPAGMAVDIAAAEQWFGTIDVIGRRYVPIPGMFEPVELRSQDPGGAFSAPMLALVDGRYPTADGETAVTDAVAESLNVGVGSTVDLDDTTWAVVGLVENPSDLSDEFALVDPSQAVRSDSVTILAAGSADQAQSFRAPSGASPTASGGPGDEGAMAAVGVLVAASMLLALVSLVAAAGFVVVAQRRLRQLGMLAAAGATERHLRLVTVANGAVVGLIAAVAGAAVGLVAWIAVVPGLETAVGQRIEPSNVPWWLIAVAMVLAVVAATAAAWWPARSAARVPIVAALSGRPPRPRPNGRPSAWGLPLVVVGIAILVIVGNAADSFIDLVLIMAGTVSFILGILLLAPSTTIRAATRLAERASVPVRLALRDLYRYRSRSGAALAAISLALGIAVAIVLASSAALYTSNAEGNLSETQLLVRIGEIPSTGDISPIPDRTQAELDQIEGAVNEIAATVDEATVTPIDVALAPDFEGIDGLPAMVLTEEVSPGLRRILSLLYVATPELLDHYEVDLDTIDPSTEILTVETGPLWLEPIEPELVQNPVQLSPGYTSIPGSFITPAGLRDRGWETAQAAWLIETTAPISDDQSAEAVRLAANAGITVETRDSQGDLHALRTGATAAGMVVALGILAMTVGLIRTETSGDVRILTATGATRRIRRSLTAATSGALALLGAVIGMAGAFLAIIAVHVRDLSALIPVPVLHLVLIGVGVPMAAAAAGWLLAGREPSTIARHPID
ncbi:MAG TPA: FtsX-like permease family protein [Jiangellaceae bacterium]